MTQPLRAISTLFLFMALALACSVETGSNSDGGDASASVLLPSGISGAISGDVKSGIRVDIELTDGTPVLVTQSDANGAYVFENIGSGTYVVKPSKDGVFFEPENRTVTFDGAGKGNVDFAAIFDFPDTVNSFSITLGRTPTDLIAIPAGNFAYASVSILNENFEDPNDQLYNSRGGGRIYALDPDQYNQNGIYDYAQEGRPGLVPSYMVPSNDSTRFYVAEISIDPAVSPSLSSFNYSMGYQKTVALDAGFNPSAIAISPNDRIVYVASENQRAIQIIDAENMISTIKLNNVEAPIALASSSTHLLIAHRSVDTGLSTTGTISLVSNTFHNYELRSTLTIPLRPRKILMSNDLSHYYILTQPDSENKASILSYRTATHESDGQWTSDAGEIPTDFTLTPNDKVMYVTLDTLSNNGRVAIIDTNTTSARYMEATNTLGGVGRSPNGVAITVRVTPVQIAGWVSVTGSVGSITSLK